MAKHNWQGDRASYNAKHKFMQRNWEKPGACEDCGKHKILDWANISGQHKRTRSDYKALCRACHIHFDRGENL